MTKKLRQIRIVGNLAYVPLTRGYEAIIDAADVPMVAGFNWYAQVKLHTAYAVRNGYSGPNHREVRMHRTIMGEPDGMDVDHCDGDGLNNRRANLREATRKQNTHNQRTRSSNTSGFKGVTWHKAGGKWQAQIMMDGRKRHLGLFDTPEAAHEAYVSASKDLHGNFGRYE